MVLDAVEHQRFLVLKAYIPDLLIRLQRGRFWDEALQGSFYGQDLPADAAEYFFS